MTDYQYLSSVALEISTVCVACDACRLICPENSIISDGKEYFIDQWSCTLCGLCIDLCPVDAIKPITIPYKD